MQALTTQVFVKRKHLTACTNVESEVTRTGFGGVLVSFISNPCICGIWKIALTYDEFRKKFRPSALPRTKPSELILGFIQFSSAIVEYYLVTGS